MGIKEALAKRCKERDFEDGKWLFLKNLSRVDLKYSYRKGKRDKLGVWD